MPSPSATVAAERLTCLAYELLDAHDDTTRLAGDLAADPRWQIHLDYLRDLQRVGRELLAQASAAGDAPADGAARRGKQPRQIDRRVRRG